MLRRIITERLTVEDRQRIARHWILMRAKARWN